MASVGIGKPLPVDFWAKIAATLSAVVSCGFLAWAALVWAAVDDVHLLVTRMATVGATVRAIDARLERIEKSIQHHSSRPWHEQAGSSISGMQIQLDTLRREYRDIREEHRRQ